MTIKHKKISFNRLETNEPIPYDLLLLADPSKILVDTYLKESDVYIARHNENVVGVIVLFPLTPDTVEIKNVGVKPEVQGEGIGSYLIENVIKIAKQNKQKKVFIGTANSSVGQLYLYQKHGFEISRIKHNYFIENYTELIYENGIQAKHLLILKMEL